MGMSSAAGDFTISAALPDWSAVFRLNRPSFHAAHPNPHMTTQGSTLRRNGRKPSATSQPHLGTAGDKGDDGRGQQQRPGYRGGAPEW